MWQVPRAVVAHSQGLEKVGQQRCLELHGGNLKVQSVEKSCNQVYLLRGVLYVFLMLSPLGRHLNCYKGTEKRKHSKLILFLISCTIQKYKAEDSLALKSASFLCYFQVIINRALMAGKAALFLQAPISCM